MEKSDLIKYQITTMSSTLNGVLHLLSKKTSLF